jgi:SWI/SNF-related matrix-associated actin-dependent regulator 1 of chromatin subfamily A
MSEVNIQERAQLLKELIKNDDRYTVGALDKLYKTAEHHLTFSSFDSAMLAGIARNYQKTGGVSPVQMRYLKKKLPKYAVRLEMNGGVIPLGNKFSPRASSRDTKKAYLKDNIVRVSFPYDKWLSEQVSLNLPGRSFDASTKEWIAPLSLLTVEILLKLDFKLSDELTEWHRKMTSRPKRTKFKLNIPGLLKDLYPYQKEGVNFFQTRGGRALLGDEMGLGKTPQTISWLQLRKELRPVVVVCQSSMKYKWAKEFTDWTGEKNIAILEGRSNKKEQKRYFKKINIINYEILPAWKESIKKHLKPVVIVFDEVQYIKNPSAKRTRASKSICNGCPHIIMLSGTPAENRVAELYTPISILDPSLLGSSRQFQKYYCDDGDELNQDKMQQLHKLLTDTVMLRRRKADVLTDLPPKMRSIIPIELTNKKEYNRAYNDLLGWLEDVDPSRMESAQRAEALVKIGVLKRLCVKGKMPMMIEWMKDFIDTGEKLVVFAYHRSVLDQLWEIFKKQAVQVRGGINATKKFQAEQDFQNSDKIRIFLGQLKAAGTGLTLTAASNTTFTELGWTPMIHDQAEDRVHRISQVADSVNAWYLLSQGTIEEELAELIDNKRRILTAVLDGRKVDKESMLTELLKKIKRRG